MSVMFMEVEVRSRPHEGRPRKNANASDRQGNAIIGFDLPDGMNYEVI
jgi:hypothetical protein